VIAFAQGRVGGLPRVVILKREAAAHPVAEAKPAPTRQEQRATPVSAWRSVKPPKPPEMIRLGSSDRLAPADGLTAGAWAPAA